jgi:hypothetical protein
MIKKILMYFEYVNLIRKWNLAKFILIIFLYFFEKIFFQKK